MKNSFLKLSVLVISIISLFSCNAQEKENKKWQREDTVKIKGSEALFYPVRDIIANHKKQFIKEHIDLESTGSTVGIMELINGNADIALSTRKLTKQEQNELALNNIKLKEVKICKEVVVIVTNSKNSVFQLSKKELAGIFSGSITSWDSVGGLTEPIKVFIRPNNTGCYYGFKSMLLDRYGKDYSENALSLKSNSEIKSYLIKYPFGISFLGYGSFKVNTFLNKGIKPIRVQNSSNEFVFPSVENINSGQYDLTRDCYIYYKEENAEKFNNIINTLKSNDSKVIFQDFGFIYLN